MSFLSTSGGMAGGSLVSILQSFGAGGAAGTAAVLSGTAIIGGVIAAASTIGVTGAVLGGEYKQAQTKSLGDGDSDEKLSLSRKNGGYVLMWENWVHGQFFRCFDTFEEALEVSNGGRKPRRMIVRLVKNGEPEITNDHNQTNPWKEVHFDGDNVLVDNTLRRFLSNKLDACV